MDPGVSCVRRFSLEKRFSTRVHTWEKKSVIMVPATACWHIHLRWHILAPLGNPFSMLTGVLNLCFGALSMIRTLNIDEGRAGLCVCGALNSITDFFTQVWTPLRVFETYCRFKKRRSESTRSEWDMCCTLSSVKLWFAAKVGKFARWQALSCSKVTVRSQ